jgi:hypothetical protein
LSEEEEGLMERVVRFIFDFFKKKNGRFELSLTKKTPFVVHLKIVLKEIDMHDKSFYFGLLSFQQKKKVYYLFNK